ncbi:MAG: HPP family protein [Haloplanus sp.]
MVDPDRIVARVADAARRLRRVERRELAAFGRWLQTTGNLLHLTVLVAVPLLIWLVTFISNATTELSFLLFPPLASGAYTLFSDPEGRYASPRKFVLGLTVGALCGWAALAAAGEFYGPGVGETIHPSSAAVSIFLTGAATWALDVEEPAAFSTALLILVTNDASPEAYVTSVAVFGTLVAVAFAVWRDRFYERRARYLYDTARSDDHVLVPMRGEAAELTATFGARLAAAHEAGKVVLLAVVEEGAESDEEADEEAEETATVEAGHRETAPERGSDDVAAPTGVERTSGEGEGETTPPLDGATAAVADRLEGVAATIRTEVGVPCEVVVASGDPVATTVRTAGDANCDLVVTPYEEDRGLLSAYVRGVFDSRFDTLAFRSTTGKRRWRRVLVTVSRPGDTAHAMLEFGARLAGRRGTLSVCTCVSSEMERRGAEKRLANLAETVDVDVETRVARSEVTEFIAANAGAYDLLLLGSSGERSRASRFVSPPTFERLRTVDCDVAVFDRGRP